MPKKQEKRADGRYAVYLSMGRDSVTGKRIRKTFYGDTQREAKQKRDQWLQSQETPQNDTVSTFADWADRWLTIYGQGSYSVLASNENAIQKLKDAIGHIPLGDVRKSDLQVFANSISSMSFSSVKKIQSVTCRIFREAVADALLDKDPSIGVKWDYADKGSHRALSIEERSLIVSNWHFHRAGAWCMIMLFAGLRRGELIALQGKDVDLESGIIHVTKAGHFEGNNLVIEDQPKSLAGIRDVPILSPLRPCLEALGVSGDTFLCQSADGKPITKTGFTKGLGAFMNILCDAANGRDPANHQLGRPHRLDLSKARSPLQRLEWEMKNAEVDAWEQQQAQFSFRAHDLRHTYCTMLYDADVDLKTAQYLMGHADTEMTLKVYTHLSETKKLSSIEKLMAYADLHFPDNF